jgi:hypothetical protein
MSLIPETLVPLSTRRYPCVADVLTSSGDTSRMSEYVIASYVDEVGDKHEFPLIITKQLDHIIIGIVDLPLFGYTLARLFPHNRLDQMRLALVNGAMNRSAPANPIIQDTQRLPAFLRKIASLLEENARVVGICNHPHAHFQLNWKPNVDLSTLRCHSYIPRSILPQFNHNLVNGVTMDSSNPCQTTTLALKLDLPLLIKKAVCAPVSTPNPLTKLLLLLLLSLIHPSTFTTNYDFPFLLYNSTRLEVGVLLYSLATTKRSYCFFHLERPTLDVCPHAFWFLFFTSQVHCSDESNLWPTESFSSCILTIFSSLAALTKNI